MSFWSGNTGRGSVVGIDIDPALLNDMQRRIERACVVEAAYAARKSMWVRCHFLRRASMWSSSKDSMVQIPDKPAIYAEVLRVLRPGGRFIASDWLRGGTGAYPRPR